MGKIRFGIIGAGHVGVGSSRGDSFVRILKVFSDRAHVTAICDINPENAQRAAEYAGDGVQAFTDLNAFLDSGVEAVVVATPVRFHVEQSVAALRRDIHVLSEVPAAHTMEAAKQLADAARNSRAVYMFGENIRYLDEVELVKRMVDDGGFGETYYAEGEYLHDCKDLWLGSDGKPTWRGRQSGKAPGYGVYCTHSLGPALYLLDDRVVQVSALANEQSVVVPERSGWFNFTMLMRTAKGAVVKVRVDTVSNRPHTASYFSLQGTKACYESSRGLGDEAKVWLADEHEESHVFDSAKWHRLWDYAQRYIPDRLRVGEEARQGGHGTCEYWMMKDFLAAIRGEQPTTIDVYRGLDYTVPGICALESMERGGAAVAVPDFRGEAI